MIFLSVIRYINDVQLQTHIYIYIYIWITSSVLSIMLWVCTISVCYYYWRHLLRHTSHEFFYISLPLNYFWADTEGQKWLGIFESMRYGTGGCDGLKGLPVVLIKETHNVCVLHSIQIGLHLARQPVTHKPMGKRPTVKASVCYRGQLNS